MTILAAAQDNPVLPNATFFAELVAFLIILFVIRKWVVPPIQKSMQDRQDAIRSQFEESQRAKERLEAAEQEYRQALVEARHEAARLREEAREQGATIIAEMREQAQSESHRIVTSAQQQIEADRQQALAQLRGEVGAIATELAGRIVGESLADDARQRRVVDRFLTELEEQAQATSGAGQPEQVS